MIRAAAIDVWYGYPTAAGPTPPSTWPFHKLDNLIMTPHSSGITRDTFVGRTRDVAENITLLMAGEPLRRVVSPAVTG